MRKHAHSRNRGERRAAMPADVRNACKRSVAPGNSRTANPRFSARKSPDRQPARHSDENRKRAEQPVAFQLRPRRIAVGRDRIAERRWRERGRAPAHMALEFARQRELRFAFHVSGSGDGLCRIFSETPLSGQPMAEVSCQKCRMPASASGRRNSHHIDARPVHHRFVGLSRTSASGVDARQRMGSIPPMARNTPLSARSGRHRGAEVLAQPEPSAPAASTIARSPPDSALRLAQTAHQEGQNLGRDEAGGGLRYADLATGAG